MSTATIAAEGIPTGATIDVGGLPFVAHSFAIDGVQHLYFHTGDLDGEQVGHIALPLDAEVTVSVPEPPDPDTEVIEAMVGAMKAHILVGVGTSTDAETKLRHYARSALAAAREAGAL